MNYSMGATLAFDYIAIILLGVPYGYDIGMRIVVVGGVTPTLPCDMGPWGGALLRTRYTVFLLAVGSGTCDSWYRVVCTTF